MTEISDLRKKLTLFVGYCSINGKFEGLTNEMEVDVGGIKRTKKTFENWRYSTIPSEKDTAAISAFLVKELSIMEDDNSEVHYDLFRSPMGVMTFGHKLGLTRPECRFFIDELYGNYLPSIPLLSTEKGESEHIVRDHGGLYIMYRIDHHEDRGWGVTQIPISIRYMLLSNKPGASNLYRIRCKSLVPSLAIDGLMDYEYDGYLSSTPNAWYWVFQMRHRSDADKDLMFAVTDAPKGRCGVQYLRGELISKMQHLQSPENWKIIIVRDMNYYVKKDNRGNVFFQLYKNGSEGPVDEEKEFLESNCRFVQMEEFENSWILTSLLMERHIPHYHTPREHKV